MLILLQEKCVSLVRKLKKVPLLSDYHCSYFNVNGLQLMCILGIHLHITEILQNNLK